VYFYDGPHDYKSHRNVLSHFSDVLSDVLIFIVDDYNDKSGKTQELTLQGIKDAGYAVAYHVQCGCNKDSDLFGWWCGLGIFLLTKSGMN
jgi:hypothetical protein